MAHPTDDKNFRLPTHVRPRRYQAHLALDLAARAFQGTQTVQLAFERPARELVLHALELTLDEVRLVSGGRTLAPSAVTVKKESETVVLAFADEVPAGEAELHVRWRGSFTQGLRGLYLAGQVAATQFEAADARRVFPCFDEPAFKARWALSVSVPQGTGAALGNGRVAKEEPEAGGGRRVTFAETELLSSYLVALVVGPLTGTPEEKTRDGTPVRTWALAEKASLSRFGQDAALAVLPRLQEYFGTPYIYDKVDQVGIPDFEAGAMENAGLITYREVALLLDPESAPLSVQKRVAEVVTHELAHQWFGNLVTMQWWDDLWLNEAFATWMAYKIVDGWKPHWRVWLDFDQGKAAALHLDALKSTHPVRGEVRNAAEAGESFDLITYEKGGAVLRMIEGFLGEAAFRDGIRRYMKRHARANTVADDLWGALAEASAQPVVELANRWIRQSGFPLVSVSGKGRTLTLTQRRFYSEPGVRSDETWPVPVVLRYRDAKGGEVREQRVLLEGKEARVELGAEPAWVCANAGNTGFYRVAYDAPLLHALAQGVGELAPSERIALLADQWALVRAGEAEVGAFLQLAARFGDEQDYAVLDELVGRLAYVEGRLVDGVEQQRFREWVERLFKRGLERAGWESATGEDDAARLRRAALVRAVGLVARSPDALAQARPRVERVLDGHKDALEPNLLDAGVAMVARDGDTRLFDRLVQRLTQEQDPATKRRYLLALTAFEEPQLAQRAQGLLLTDVVPVQDVASFANGLLANRTGREGFWGALQKDVWAGVLQRTGSAPMLLRRVVEALGNLRERRHLDEARAFLAAHPLPEAKQAVEQTLERLAQDVALRERLAPQVSDWLRAQR